MNILQIKNVDNGLFENITTENVIVENCVVYHGHGGFVVGSEMSGDVRNIKVRNGTYSGNEMKGYVKPLPIRGGTLRQNKR